MSDSGSFFYYHGAGSPKGLSSFLFLPAACVPSQGWGETLPMDGPCWKASETLGPAAAVGISLQGNISGGTRGWFHLSYAAQSGFQMEKQLCESTSLELAGKEVKLPRAWGTADSELRITSQTQLPKVLPPWSLLPRAFCLKKI